MPTAGPEQVVARPPLEPPVTGLLQAADVVEHDDDHWLAGIRWAPGNNVALSAVDPCAFAGSLSSAASHPSPLAYYPFALVEEDTCSPWSFREADFRSYATEGLLAKEWGALEAEFERGGLFAANPHLADATSPTLSFPGSTANSQATSIAVSPADALALLDEAIATSGIGLGMIHAPAYLVDKWVSSHSVKTNPETTDPVDVRPTIAPHLFSPKGNIIVAGNGYTGVAPDGTEGTHATALWAYATGLVTVHRDRNVSFTPATGAEALNRTTNLITWRAWRVYALAWNRLLHAAVRVSAPLAVAGGGGTAASPTTVANRSTRTAENSALLLATATRNGASQSTAGYARFRAFASSDVAGTLNVQQSRDGTTWYITTTTAVAAGSTTGTVLESEVVLDFARVQYVNGASDQTAFELDSALLAI